MYQNTSALAAITEYLAKRVLCIHEDDINRFWALAPESFLQKRKQKKKILTLRMFVIS